MKKTWPHFAHAVVTVLLAVALIWQWRAANAERAGLKAELTKKIEKVDHHLGYRTQDIREIYTRLRNLEAE
ncbi:MAG: hypothetical protein OXU79_19775 [Gemmatimonadota bacterium]|nr:hypothetical protein [Gemmatimonadota bacterium]